MLRVLGVYNFEIFMEQELRFGLDLGRFGNFWGQFFLGFHGQKIFFKNILDGENIFGIEWSWKNIFFFLKKF